MRLERYEYTETGTYGQLWLPDGQVLQTLEPPWADNLPFVSCVPEGLYALLPHDTEKYPSTWALEGETVSHWPSDKARYSIVMHNGNYASDTSGCILVAEQRQGLAIKNTSRGKGMARLRSTLKNVENPKLSITDATGEVNTMPEEASSGIETTPSAPTVGATRDLVRTVSGWIVGYALTLLGKVGLSINLTEDMQNAAAIAIGSLIISPLLAWAGKINRQSASPTTIRGQIF